VLLLVCLGFSALETNGQEERYWGTIIRNPPANYVLRMDDGKILNAEWESGYDQWSIGERIILTIENGSASCSLKTSGRRSLFSPMIRRKLEIRGSRMMPPDPAQQLNLRSVRLI
jgi:hypothetical protein